jgi:hypothetical protein
LDRSRDRAADVEVIEENFWGVRSLLRTTGAAGNIVSDGHLAAMQSSRDRRSAPPIMISGAPDRSERRPSFITNYIEVDAHALLVRKLGRTIAREWLVTGRLPVVRALPAEEERGREIVARHTDKDWPSAMRSRLRCSRQARSRGSSRSSPQPASVE